MRSLRGRAPRHGGRGARVLLLLPLWFWALLGACAPTRRPLPAVPPEELPKRWIAELANEACPPPFSARLQIRIESKGEPAVSLEGSLLAVPPDTLKLTAGVGAFRPAFVLTAGADSCELLLHEGGRYWITPRESPSRAGLSPAAWCAALTWALCPSTFFRRFEPDGSGRFEPGVWVASGRVAGSPWLARAEVRLADRHLAGLQLIDAEGVLVEIHAAAYSADDHVTLPERLEINRPRDGWRLWIQRRSLERLPADRRPSVAPVRPPGWTAVGPEGLDLRPLERP